MPHAPRDSPGFQQVVLGVTEQDVGLPPLGESGVRMLVRDVPFEWAFAWTARIDAEIRNGQLNARAAAAQCESIAATFHGHPKQQELLGLVAKEGREFFNTPYVHALQRLLVLDARDGSQEVAGDLRRLQDALLGVCNVVSLESTRPLDFDPDHYVALMVRSGVVNTTESMVDAITRAYTIYHEMPRRPDAPAMPNYCSPELWAPDAERGVSVHERFMIGMAVMGNVGVWDEKLPSRERPTGVPPDYFVQLARELDSKDSQRLSCAISGDRAFFRQMFRREKPELATNALNIIPFQVRPLLAQTGGGYLLSSTNALASWMTRGVHYACLTPHEGTPTAHAFLTYVGRLFEAYAVELLQSAHNGQSAVRVLDEHSYDAGGSQTSDIAIADGSDLVLLEIEAHRFTKEALLSGDSKLALKELDTMIVSKARQIDRCIMALRRPEAPATLPGVRMSDIERIWPVVVIEGGITQNALLWEHLAKRLDGTLQQTGVQRLAVMSMNELEAAAGFIEHGHRLAMLLHRWKFGSCKDTDFTYYCSITPGLQRHYRARLVRERWQSLTEEVNSVFSKKTQNPRQTIRTAHPGKD
jgi:hypothetical protein